jgi:hypothetical protein
MCGVPLAASKVGQSFYCPLYVSQEELARFGVDLELMIMEGMRLFHRHFGFRSLSTVAPNVTWTDGAERIWSRQGVRYIQGGPYQYKPSDRRRHVQGHYLGERSAYDGWYLVRNCVFEPSKTPQADAVDRCLRDIYKAFSAQVPAVIGTHRVNYVGSVEPRNRGRGVAELRRLLEAVLTKWPDACFLSTPELGCMIESGTLRVQDLPDRLAGQFAIGVGQDGPPWPVPTAAS